ncbi:MAG: hypothetical protein ACXWA3_07990 [Acidimicrobiales bacterium]
MAIGVLATLVIVLAVVVVTHEDKTSTVSSDTTETTETSTTTTSAPPTTPPNGDLRGVVQRLDVLLQSSARARSDVVDVVAKVSAGCELEPYQAGNTMYTAEQSRQQVISELSALQVTGNQQADKLVAQLLAAIQSSQHANQHYLAWIENVYAQYYYDNTVWDETTGQATTTCPGPPPKTSQDWTDATAASSEATAAKKAFVAAYNPVAQQFDVRTWSETEF